MKRVLFVSSPIGLGHAQRDVAIARELRARVPDLRIDWLAQHPVTEVLAAEGERIHPASVHLASESGHFESESAEHDLHCFHAWRRMDEILVANFMLFHDVVSEDAYDLWIADEGWEIDYFLHEHPELKRAPYVWLTDFVGLLPVEDGDDYERFLARDYNAEMVEHVAASPGLRDRALFVGNREDVVPAALGDALPMIAEWTEQHFDFTGYISGFDPVHPGDREALREELGYGEGEKVCLVSVGGSGIGETLLRRVIEAYPLARRRVPELRMVVVAGPRIDPAGLPQRTASRCAATSTTCTGTCRLRPGGRAGRIDDRDGADRQPAPVPLLPARAPLRAANPCGLAPGALSRRPAPGVPRVAARGDRRGDRGGDRAAGRLSAGGDRRRCPRRGTDRGAAVIDAVIASAPTPLEVGPEPTRALYPHTDGFVEHGDGVRVFYEVYGEGDDTLCLLPPVPLFDSRSWRLQVPYLARHFRVITIDPRGNGRSDRPRHPAAYSPAAHVEDVLAVLDATATPAAMLASLSPRAPLALALAVEHPERVRAVVFVTPQLWAIREFVQPFAAARSDRYDGYEKWNRHYLLADWEGFVPWFAWTMAPHSHSTRLIEEITRHALETDGPTVVAALIGFDMYEREEALALARTISCPVLVTQNGGRAFWPKETSGPLAEATGGRLDVFEGLGPAVGARWPVDPATDRYTLPEEHALALADEDSPFYVLGAYELIASLFADEERITEAFRTGAGLGWHAHDHRLFRGTERFFRPGYRAHLVGEWIAALDGVQGKLELGAKVADIGCGNGASTIIMAEAFPNSRFYGYDYHAASIERAREAALQAGVEDRVTFEVAAAKSYPGDGYDLVCAFDCLHDMGDPVGASGHVLRSLAPGGTWMIVEPNAGDHVEDNLNPIGRVFYGASTVICTPASLDQEVGLALGAQAGEARLTEVIKQGGFAHVRRATETPFNIILEACA